MLGFDLEEEIEKKFLKMKNVYTKILMVSMLE